MKVRNYSLREFQKILDKNGFERARSKGDHFIYKRNGVTISINKNPNAMVMRRLIKENGLFIDKF